jgi:hypothetical protein
MDLKEEFQWDILDTYFLNSSSNNKTAQIDSYNFKLHPPKRK